MVFVGALTNSIHDILLYSVSDKNNKFSDKFDVLYLRENSSWMGGVQHLTSSGALFLEVLGKNRVFECEKRQREPGLDWPGG